MTSFLALYRGETVSGARLVALSADPEMVRDFAARLVTDEPAEEITPREMERLAVPTDEQEGCNG
jgi:hypothetical protein